jgi:hypothetical protein
LCQFEADLTRTFYRDGEYSDLQDNASMDSEDVTYSDVNKPRPAKSASSNPNNLKLVLKIGQVKNEAGLDHPMDPNIMNPPTYPATEPPGAKMTENPLKIKIRLSGGGRDAMTGAPLLPTHTGTPSKGKRTRPGEHMESDDMALEEEHVTPTQPRGRGRPSSRQKRKREEGIGTPQSPASSYQTGVEEDEDSDSDFENRSQSSSHLLDQSGLVGVEGMDTFNMPHGRGRGKKNDKKAGAVGTPATPQGAGPTGNAQSTKKKQQPKTRSSMRKKQKKKQPSSPTSGGQETYGSYESDPENLDAPHPYYCTPPNFWKNLEPYFQDLTQADIDALMPKNDGIDPDDVYFHLPALGTHYKDVWQEEDEKGIDSSYGRQSSRLTTSRGQFGDMTHDEGLDGFGDNNMLAQSKDHFAEEEPVRCENFTSRILSAMLEEHLTLPGSYGQSPLNKKAMDGRQGNPFNKSGTMPLNRSVSGYGADPFGGEFENGGYGAPNYPNNPLGLAIPLGIAPVEGYSYQSQLLLNEKIKQELMNLGLDLSEPEVSTVAIAGGQIDVACITADDTPPSTVFSPLPALTTATAPTLECASRVRTAHRYPRGDR